jgi:uncharacterized protein YfaS (alpha-2-macroglobulin family)
MVFGIDVSKVAAQDVDGTLSGKIIAFETGEPIPGATVQIRELDEGIVTNQQGEFEFSNISSGSYTLLIQSVGFSTKSVNVDHPDDG